MFFCTNNATSKSIILSCIFLYEKFKNYSIQSFKEFLFFVFCLFYFLILSNKILHVMFYSYICYWNTMPQNNPMCEWLQKIFVHSLSYIYLPISVFSRLRFISWSSPPFSLFNWPCAPQPYIRFEVIYYPLFNIFWIYWMFIYAFVLARYS